MFLGGLIELILPLPALAVHKVAAEPSLGAPLLQAVGAAANIPALTPAPIAEPTAERRPCLHCGKPLAVGTKFCGGCGAHQD